MAKISPYAFWQELNDNGDPLAAGKLYTYEAGTSTDKVTYTDSAESGSNTNPVILDSAGRADVWLDSGSYKFVLKDSADVTIKTVDDITGGASDVYSSGVVDVTANRPVTIADQNLILDCVGTFTLTLLDVATAEEGFVFVVRNSSTGVITIDADGTETIDGSLTKDIQPDGSLNVVCNGTGWITTNENYGTTNAKTMTFTGDVGFSGKVATKEDGELTIATGAITVTGAKHTVDTEADASSDDLDTITGGSDGEIISIRANNTARTVVIKDGTGNIETPLGSDISLDSTEKLCMLQYDSALAKWLVVGNLATSSVLVQEVNTQSGATSSGTTQLPIDDTIPQNTEGNEFITLAITPTNSSNTLVIEVNAVLSANVSGNFTMVGALFQDSTAGSLAVSAGHQGTNNTFEPISFTHTMTAGTASETTFKFRAGTNQVGTIYLNGTTAGRLFGGVLSSSMTIREIEV